MICMAHITLSIPDETHRVMKEHPEIKWSEIARQSIIAKTLHMKKTISAREFLKLLPPETQKSISEMSEEDAVTFYKKMKEREWKRMKFLTRVQQSVKKRAR